MNVRDVISELQQYPPHMPVKIVISSVMMPPSNEHGPYEAPLSRDDAMEADRVTHQGNHVLIESK